jgi:hypothetical protein
MRLRWTGHVIHVREKGNIYKISMGKPEGERLLGRPRRRWEEGNIKVDPLYDAVVWTVLI